MPSKSHERALTFYEDVSLLTIGRDSALVAVKIDDLDRQIRYRERKEATARRLMGIPGIGPICTTALEALAPPPETFVKGLLPLC